MYVGKAKNLKNRVSSYFQNSKNLLEKTRILVSQIEKIKSVIAESEIQALLLEANYIKLYKPKYNAKLTDDKAYPLIRITAKDKYPKVLIARRSEDIKSIYFGPFPNSSALRLVLKTIRRIFPFQSVAHHPNKICLYNHLGICPCPEVTNDRYYNKNINHIITFLKGNTKKVLKNLEKERDVLSKLEEFEQARDLQRKIDAINYVTSPAYEKFDFKINPNLEEDLRYKELLELKTYLLSHNVSVEKLERIECYDISNISGYSATGSMVVFANGVKDSSWYRKFKIRTVDKVPNDFAMMQEVLERRLRHGEWPYPDLIVVDGGKGQVSAALNALNAHNSTMKQFNNETINIPVIGLAKREETIITSDFKEIKLPEDSEALKLIMRIRDEAHRFAVTYHRRLRSKRFLTGI
ncbi:MAG: hypothetical protein A3D74_04385 [Candidatus Levybacteria bacterium RIFCSPHIGHO2_02_FULL_37_13]|nr:MAG: hypothetical protein A3D74_04385 [Candidatus Levybacteria bacterium RIFCSPHIGHO2_02_FULL_37_13]OGH30611.1 MAG: hypothetical protein A3E40_01680 [Candidatus Levybacteria bacterium RIFCSPHIGHO2_12_FULL_37_9]OGH40531.1 MAG: hypothetical protein A3B41_02845 [Candidatus Levybacteria bacterium RIFCSPLOWO2_01_FULL_37_26]